jgi:hypothetical protein
VMGCLSARRRLQARRRPLSAPRTRDAARPSTRRWELWTSSEPFADLPLHALLHALSQPGGLALPLPGDRDWDAASPPEPAPGWERLVRRCWARDAAERPRASEVVSELEDMAVALRRRRAAAAAAAAPGPGATPGP